MEIGMHTVAMDGFTEVEWGATLCSSYTLINTTRVSFAISDNQLNSNSKHLLIIPFNHWQVTTQYL